MEKNINYRRRRIMVGILAVVVVFMASKLVSAAWGFVQQRWEASASVTPSNPISATPTHTRNVEEVPACAEDEIAVSVFLDQDSTIFDMKTNVLIHATITNMAQEKCLRDVGSTANEIRVLDSAGKQVWSSDTCPVKETINLVELMPQDVARITLTWGGNVDPTKCGKLANHVAAGDYSIVALNGKAESQPLPISFVATTATASN